MRAPDFVSTPFATDPRFVRDAVGGLVWHRAGCRVLFADTDRTGAVYHATYLRFFELGRTTLLRDAGFPWQQVEHDGFSYPIVRVELDYFRPAAYDDPLVVHTRLADLHGVRIRFDYLITHGDTGQVLCKGFTTHCAVNRMGKPVAVDAVTAAIYRDFPA